MRTLIATLLASAPLQVLAQGTEPAAVAAVGNVGGGSLALQLGQLALGLGFVVGLIVLLGKPGYKALERLGWFFIGVAFPLHVMATITFGRDGTWLWAP